MLKKHLSLILALALCACLLSACGARKSTESAPGDVQKEPVVEATEVPEEGAHGEEDQSAALEAMPTLEPVEPITDEASAGSDDYFSIDAMLEGVDTGTPSDVAQGVSADDSGAQNPDETPKPVAVLDPTTYQYSALTDTSLGFTFNYPSHWENLPGVFSVCFREKVEPDDYPARVSITAKRLVHTPDNQALTDELTSYVRIIHKQYDAATFQAGTPNTDDRFLGQPALSNTYLAYSGEHEVKGYILGTSIGRTMYVFHFSATYEDFTAMQNLMRYMADSAEIVDKDD